MEPVNSAKIDRRAILLGAVLLVGGAAALTRFTRKGGGLAGATGPALAAEQFALLEQICETIIPATDTPGAIAVGVPAFVRRMLEEWSSPQSRLEIVDVLAEIEKRAWNRFGAAFLELPAERRLEIVSAFDAESVARQDRGYGKFKFLVLAGYYQSETGATRELRYELVPGAWRSCVPLTEIGRASAV